jgi:hypothetical protein
MHSAGDAKPASFAPGPRLPDESTIFDNQTKSENMDVSFWGLLTEEGSGSRGVSCH